MEIYGDAMCLGGIWVLRPFSMGLLTLLWHRPERHNFFNLTILKHPNIQMSVYKVDKKTLGYVNF